MNSLRILLLEDSLLDAEIIQTTLLDAGIFSEFIRVDNRNDFVNALETDVFDLIISDYSLPSFDGFSALDFAQALCPEIPFILVSAALGEEVAIEALKQGATDYVLKQRLGRLVPSVQRALREARERQQRQRAEKALRENEVQFQRLIANLPGMICRFTSCEANTETVTYTYVSSGIRELFELTPEAVLQDARVIWNQIHPVDFPSFKDSMSTAVQQGCSWHWEGRIITPSGQTKWIQGSARPEQLIDGNVWDGLLFDITDRKQMEQALSLEERRYRSLCNAIPQLLWVNDADGKIQFFNQRWQEYTGVVDLTAGIGLWRNVIHPDDLQPVSLIRDRAVVAKEAYEVECRLKQFDQTYRWHLARIVPLKDEQGHVLSWYGTATDIDDIKQMVAGQRFLAEASSALATSLNYQATLTRIAQLVVPFLADYCFFDVVKDDHEQTIERVAWHHGNPQKQEWMNQIVNYIPPMSVKHHPVSYALLKGSAMFITHVTEEWLQSIALSAEHLQFMQAAELRSLMTIPLIVQDRILGALTFCFTSDSDRHYTQADLTLANELAHRAALALDNAQLYQQAQNANRAKDQFLAVLSHELRTPLNPILGWSKLLQSPGKDESVINRGLEAIERNARLQTQLIEDLLDISRILRGKLQLDISSVNLRSVIEGALDTIRLAAEAKSIQIQTRFDPAVNCIAGDFNRLQQVVWNLLSNSVKFTPEGGRIRVSLQSIDSCAQIQVTDTGKGITPGFLPYVFDYFRQADSKTTRQFGGLGLGLAIVRHIVEMHGGTVEASSPGEGQGSTLTIKLPIPNSQPGQNDNASRLNASSESIPPTSLQPLSSIQILAVDDDPDALELLVSILNYAGATVFAASSAIEALNLFRQTNPDVLISDIEMPQMDGCELVRAIQALTAAQETLPVTIALTAYAEEIHQQQALAAGFQLYITKPVQPHELVRTIAMLTQSPR
ncbi:response regulator [Egbenema bharatensis]|uniref:response regulator n=1 Tax=Egbenema bharatensis TaxID=3463334 RepID=UPI003A8986E8